MGDADSLLHASGNMSLNALFSTQSKVAEVEATPGVKLDYLVIKRSKEDFENRLKRQLANVTLNDIPPHLRMKRAIKEVREEIKFEEENVVVQLGFDPEQRYQEFRDDKKQADLKADIRATTRRTLEKQKQRARSQLVGRLTMNELEDQIYEFARTQAREQAVVAMKRNRKWLEMEAQALAINRFNERKAQRDYRHFVREERLAELCGQPTRKLISKGLKKEALERHATYVKERVQLHEDESTLLPPEMNRPSYVSIKSPPPGEKHKVRVREPLLQTPIFLGPAVTQRDHDYLETVKRHQKDQQQQKIIAKNAARRSSLKLSPDEKGKARRRKEDSDEELVPPTMQDFTNETSVGGGWGSGAKGERGQAANSSTKNMLKSHNNKDGNVNSSSTRRMHLPSLEPLSPNPNSPNNSTAGSNPSSNTGDWKGQFSVSVSPSANASSSGGTQWKQSPKSQVQNEEIQSDIKHFSVHPLQAPPLRTLRHQAMEELLRPPPKYTQTELLLLNQLGKIDEDSKKEEEGEGSNPANKTGLVPGDEKEVTKAKKSPTNVNDQIGSHGTQRWLETRGAKVVKKRVDANEKIRYRQLFDLLDDDHSGALEVQEVMDALTMTGLKISHADLAFLTKAINPNGKAILTFDEFVDGFAAHSEWDTIFNLIQRQQQKKSRQRAAAVAITTGQEKEPDPVLPFMLWVPAYHRKMEIRNATDLKRVKNDNASALTGLATRVSSGLASLSEIWNDVQDFISQRRYQMQKESAQKGGKVVDADYYQFVLKVTSDEESGATTQRSTVEQQELGVTAGSAKPSAGPEKQKALERGPESARIDSARIDSARIDSARSDDYDY